MELSGENRRLERSGLHRRPLAALLHWVRLERCTPSAQAIWKRKNERFGTRAVTTLGFQRLTARRWLRVQQGPLQPKQQTNWHNRDTGFYYLILVFDSKRCSITAHFLGVPWSIRFLSLISALRTNFAGVIFCALQGQKAPLRWPIQTGLQQFYFGCQLDLILWSHIANFHRVLLWLGSGPINFLRI